MDGGATAGSSHDQPIAGPMDGGAASGGSSHDDNAHTESGAMNTGAAASDSSVDFEITEDEYKELVQSTKPFRASVVRIIDFNEKDNKVIGTGSAFLVSRRGNRSLFLTCDHNFARLKKGEVRVIRFLDGDRDYTIEKVIIKDKDRDLLLFSVKDVGDRRCVEFSTEKVEQFDKVVVLGYSAPVLNVKNGTLDFACVKALSIFPGKVLCHPYRSASDMVYEKVISNCKATRGVSGSPLFKNGKVIAVHLGADKDWRDAVSINTLQQVLERRLNIKNDNDEYTVKDLLEMVLHKKLVKGR